MTRYRETTVSVYILKIQHHTWNIRNILDFTFRSDISIISRMLEEYQITTACVVYQEYY
jgi:hypothetical protein